MTEMRMRGKEKRKQKRGRAGAHRQTCVPLCCFHPWLKTTGQTDQINTGKAGLDARPEWIESQLDALRSVSPSVSALRGPFFPSPCPWPNTRLTKSKKRATGTLSASDQFGKGPGEVLSSRSRASSVWEQDVLNNGL